MKQPFVHESIQLEVKRQAENHLLPDHWHDWSSTALTHELGVYHVELELQNEELRLTNVDLETERQHFRTLYEHAPIAYFTLDTEGIVLSVNQAGLRLLDVQHAHLLRRRFALFIAPQQRALFSQLLADLFGGEIGGTHPFMLERHDGEQLNVQVQGLTLPATRGRPPELLMTLVDVTPLSQAQTHLERLNATLEHRIQQGTQQLRDLNAQLRHQVSHDHLTGLPNRAAFTECLQTALDTLKDTGRCFAVLFCDLDRFKLINDTLGHVAGDQVLTRFGRRLQATTRSNDQVSRLGGDEFAMLLHRVDSLQDVLTVVGRLEASMQEPVVLEQHTLTLNMSMGVLLVTEQYETAEQILNDVDLALYQAKRNGRACAKVFEPGMRDGFQERPEL